MATEKPSKIAPNIEKTLKSLPTSPGVYLMKGAKGETIYIGKAKNLKSRVRSYFTKSSDTRYAVQYLITKTKDIETILTTNEKEALILEETLLKKFKPRYNIRLKDDKTYVSIKLTAFEDFPRISVTRQIKKDGSRYFGPYASAGMVRETLKYLRKIFPLCICTQFDFRNRSRDCLDYQIGLCSAPATGRISKEDYAVLVRDAVLFLEGKNKKLLSNLKKEMKDASDELKFEKASECRDRLHAIKSTLEEQKVVSQSEFDKDVLAIAREDKTTVIQVLFIRGGSLVSSKHFSFTTALSGDDILSSFITQFYSGSVIIPDEVLLPIDIDDKGTISEWLTDKKGTVVGVRCPQRGENSRLVQMAHSNAVDSLKNKMMFKESVGSVLTKELQKRLKLKKPPNTIEAFDISNISGENAVGGMVTFTDGEPNKSLYRKFKIKTKNTPDDYAMMEEVLTRRYAETSTSGPPLPDMILIDGGKGQLNIAVKVLRSLKIKNVVLASIAKDKPEMAHIKSSQIGQKKPSKGERIFMPNVKDPIVLKENSKPDILLRRIRDEVHRFSITYHRKLRSKRPTSVLDNISGIGKAKKIALLKHFREIGDIKKATLEELAEVPGITIKLAEKIKLAL